MFQQHGIHCPNCDEDIYSNNRYDLVECRGGCVYIDGGWDQPRYGSVGLGDIIHTSRNVDRHALPHRYRTEVPEQ